MVDTPQQSGNDASKRDILAEFQKNPAAEKMLAVAALVVLLAFIFDNRWSWLFKFDSFYGAAWFTTLAFLGSLLVIALVALDLFGVKVMEARLRLRILILLAMLPALGFIIDTLKGTVWGAVMLAGAVVMAYAAAKITTREKIIGK